MKKFCKDRITTGFTNIAKNYPFIYLFIVLSYMICSEVFSIFFGVKYMFKIFKNINGVKRMDQTFATFIIVSKCQNIKEVIIRNRYTFTIIATWW